MSLKRRARTLPLSAHIEEHDCSNRDLILRTKTHLTHKSIWINKSSVNPKSTSNQSSKPCTVLQYPSRKPRLDVNNKNLQCPAIHCNTPQRTATHRSALQHTAAHCNTPQRTATYRSALQYTANRRLGIQMFYCVLNPCRTQKKSVLTKKRPVLTKKEPNAKFSAEQTVQTYAWHMYIYILLSVCIDRNTL